MKKLHCSIEINAPVKKVWDTMLEDATYRQWTGAFNPGSFYKGSWEKGSKILFLGPDPNTGKEGGMGLGRRSAPGKDGWPPSGDHGGMLLNITRHLG